MNLAKHIISLHYTYSETALDWIVNLWYNSHMIGNIKCVKGSYDDGFYDEIEDQFYCKGCAEKYNKE